MWYFRLPGEELQAELPIGLKCVPVLMDMWDSSVNLVPRDFVMNQQMVVPLPLVYRVIAMDMQISVMLRLVAVYANTIRLVTTASAVLVATTAIRYKELRMTADTVRAQIKEPARSSWMRLLSVWSVPEDMEDRAVTCAVMATLETLQEGLDQFGCAFLVTAIRMLTLMLLVTATEPLESA